MKFFFFDRLQDESAVSSVGRDYHMCEAVLKVAGFIRPQKKKGLVTEWQCVSQLNLINLTVVDYATLHSRTVNLSCCFLSAFKLPLIDSILSFVVVYFIWLLSHIMRLNTQQGFETIMIVVIIILGGTVWCSWNQPSGKNWCIFKLMPS